MLVKLLYMYCTCNDSAWFHFFAIIVMHHWILHKKWLPNFFLYVEYHIIKINGQEPLAPTKLSTIFSKLYKPLLKTGSLYNMHNNILEFWLG